MRSSTRCADAERASRCAARVVERAAARELVRDVVEARLAARDQLERVRLVVAGEHARRARSVSPNCSAQRARRLAEVGDAQRDVVERRSAITALTRTGIRLIPLKKFDRSRSGGPASSIVVDAREQLLEDDPDLELRQVGAHAVVDAAGAEGHVRVRRAADVEAVGLLEDRLVAVAGDEPGRDLVAGLDLACRRARCRASRCGGSGAPASPSAASPRRPVLPSAGSSRSRSSCSGYSSSASRPCVIVCRVVSLPAVASSRK